MDMNKKWILQALDADMSWAGAVFDYNLFISYHYKIAHM